MQTVGQIPRRYVACLDVLGFRDALQKDTLHLAEAYWTASRKAKLRQESATFRPKHPSVTKIGEPPEGENIPIYPNIEEVAIFSDSIFVFTADESEQSLIELCEYLFETYRDFLTGHLLPLRGAVAKGEAIVDVENRVYLGKAIVDAWQLEEKLDLTGIVLQAGLQCKASMPAEVTYKCGHKEILHVPIHSSSLVKGEVNHVKMFQFARAQAGEAFTNRYKNSEPVVAAMFKLAPERLNDAV